MSKFKKQVEARASEESFSDYVQQSYGVDYTYDVYAIQQTLQHQDVAALLSKELKALENNEYSTFDLRKECEALDKAREALDLVNDHAKILLDLGYRVQDVADALQSVSVYVRENTGCDND